MADAEKKSPVLSRRLLLLGGASLVAVGGAAAFATRGGWQPGAIEHAVAETVKRVFGSDIAPKSTLEQFAKFYVAQPYLRAHLYKSRKAMVTAVSDIPALRDLIGLVPRYDRSLDDWDSDVGQAFLRHTTMTYRSADEPIEFAEDKFEPNTCTNRLARFGFDDD